MAWRKPKMAFTSNQMVALENAVTNATSNAVDVLYPYPVTEEEVIRMLIDPADIPIMRRAKELECIAHSYYWRTHCTARLPSQANVSISVSNRIPLPAYAGKHIFDQATADKLDAWCSEVHAVKVLDNKIKQTIKSVAAKCPSPQTVRYFLPSIVGLMNPEVFDRIVNGIRQFKPLRTNISLPAPLLADIRLANETLASWALLPKPEPRKGDFRLTPT